MLSYLPPESDRERRKKKKKKDNKEPDPNADNEDDELGTVDEKNLNLEVGEDVPEQVRYALSQMDERQIPLDVILVTKSFFELLEFCSFLATTSRHRSKRSGRICSCLSTRLEHHSSCTVSFPKPSNIRRRFKILDFAITFTASVYRTTQGVPDSR